MIIDLVSFALHIYLRNATSKELVAGAPATMDCISFMVSILFDFYEKENNMVK